MSNITKNALIWAFMGDFLYYNGLHFALPLMV